jgi:transglutaminase-like putative cysteine protease
VIRLHPVASPGTVVLHHSQHIDPVDHLVHWQQDPFGNQISRVSFLAPVHSIDIDVEVIAELTPRDPFEFLLDPTAEHSPFDYGDELTADLGPHLTTEAAGPMVAELLRGIDRAPQPTVDLVVGVARSVAAAVLHEVRVETGVLDPEVTLQRGIGSCRDSAWLLIQLLRHLGLAARFVSGYLVQLTPTGDLTDLHAWAEVYLPGAGWVGLDPTSGLLAAEGHIPLAAAPHPRGAAPVVGTTEPCEVRLEHTNSVRRLGGAERSTTQATAPR